MQRQSTAIVHEWLSDLAGSEKTFLEMARLLPTADLYALSDSGADWGDLHGRRIRTSFLNRAAQTPRGRAAALPLMPVAHSRLGRGEEYETVITSSHAYARYFGGRYEHHLSYVYSPIRYAWFPEIDGRGSSPMLTMPRWALRAVDKRSVERVDAFAGISTTVVERIECLYDRQATVIFPPVDTTFFEAAAANETQSAQRAPYLFSIGRLIPYKRHDLAIRLSHEIRIPLVIAGVGPEEASLRSLATELGAEVLFAGRVSDEELRTLYSEASATLFLAEEDFGIVPVESQAAGTPVLALDVGGSRDTVAGVGGLLSTSTSLPRLAEDLSSLLAAPPSAATCRQHSARFSVAAFRASLGEWVTAHSPIELDC